MQPVLTETTVSQASWRKLGALPRRQRRTLISSQKVKPNPLSCLKLLRCYTNTLNHFRLRNRLWQLPLKSLSLTDLAKAEMEEELEEGGEMKENLTSLNTSLSPGESKQKRFSQQHQ